MSAARVVDYNYSVTTGLAEPCPLAGIRIRSKIVVKTVRTRRMPVCLLSPHPLVLGEFERVLSGSGYKLIPRLLESPLGPDLRRMSVPRAGVFVVDAHVARAAAGALLSNILEHHPGARILVVAEKLNAAESYSLLRLGAKGLLTYAEVRDHLDRALPLVAGGGFWVPRSVLSGFVDSVLSGPGNRRMQVEVSSELSRREQEVLSGLLENLANKEIAGKLNISERTVKFHVSNLLSKFGVRRRADLILLCFQQRSVAS